MTQAFLGLAPLGIKPWHCGKVRETVDLGDRLLVVTTDRVSAFDCVLPDGLPGKGALLNRISAFWFRGLRSLLPTHFLTTDETDLPAEFAPHAASLAGRWMLVRKAERVPVECVVRGYLAGSGWAEYRGSGTVCGLRLPPGLKEFDRLPEPIFTPTTKAEQGHDEPLTPAQTADLVGKETAAALARLTLEVYGRGCAYALGRGVIIADTKFEFGMEEGKKLILIDEALTPDSSRFWPLDGYAPGGAQKSFDKQFVRDYLLSIRWDKKPPAPSLPAEVIRRTSEKYIEAYERLTGRKLET